MKTPRMLTHGEPVPLAIIQPSMALELTFHTQQLLWWSLQETSSPLTSIDILFSAELAA